MARTFEKIVEAFRAFIKSKDSSIDTSEGTSTRDIVIDAPAREFDILYEQLESISEDQSTLTASDGGLDNQAANVGLLRKTARKARGAVSFFRRSAVVSDITIPAGTQVSTTTSNVSTSTIKFLTTKEVTMYANLSGSYLNSSTGNYEITVDIEASEGGTDGNVGAETVTTIVSTLLGIDGVSNTNATSGGQDQETNTSLASRISARYTGNTIGTVDGIKSVVLSQDGVTAVSVTGNGDTSRDEFGAVDVFIKGTASREKKDSFNTVAATFEDLLLTKQPVLTGGVSTVFSSGSGSLGSSLWSLSKDTGVYAGSIFAKDKIQWSGSIGSGYGTIVATYNYNGLVEDLQALFTKTNKDVVNTDIVVRQATELAIDLECSIKVTAGYDSVTVIAQIKTDLAQFFDALDIGEDVQQGDVAKVILDVSGVDDVQLPFTTFRSSDSTVLKDSFGTLNMPANTYPTNGTITINTVV